MLIGRKKQPSQHRSRVNEKTRLPTSARAIGSTGEKYANENGLFSGTAATTFAPDETGDLSLFKDDAQISDWARGNVRWAVGAGLINGRDDGSLDLHGSTIRAEAAAVLQRFLEK